MKRILTGSLLVLALCITGLSQDTGWTDGTWDAFNEYLAEHGTDDPPLTGHNFIDFIAAKESNGELSEGTTASAMVEMALGYQIPDIVFGINLYEDMIGDGVAPEEPE